MDRRSFLTLPLAATLAARDLETEIAVIGASTGGCAAALAALRNGYRVILTEETDWIGGQLTSQAVPPDEHPWIESFGGTETYRRYRNLVRDYYRNHYPLTEAIRANPRFNPGGGSVSKLTHEPPVSLAVLRGLLQPYLSAGQLTLLLNRKPVAADVTTDRVTAVGLRSPGGAIQVIQARYFIDGTEMGDLLPLTRCEYRVGFESRQQTGEPSAPETPQPANQQSFTVCFAMDHLAGEDHRIERPAQYTFWRDYLPSLKPVNWPDKLLSWKMSNPITLAERAVYFDPTEDASRGDFLNLWIYRRIARKQHHTDGFLRSDISLVNWPQNDYWLGNLIDVPPAEAAKHLEGGRQLSLSLLYWMQTEAPRLDGKQGWPGLRIRPDITGTDDGLAKYPYIRESRRIQAEFIVAEQHVSTAIRKKEGKGEAAEVFSDSVGVGSYRIDLHPSTGGDNYIDVSSLPFQIPLGALLPVRLENLLPACKNLGTTHITNGCYRLHPVEWNIGESAGMLAAEALRLKIAPRAIRKDAKRLAELQARLMAQGIEIAWPKLSPR
ncbi:MAG: FAD-dependent oxidoreductase [Bryobacteraceae bacterium]|nr:FAD-dependent oxidoreductase [Bryobacteraceae bacterium]